MGRCTNCVEKRLRDLLKAEREKSTALESENRELRDMLRRYVQEVPLGHQPHMAAQDAEALLGVQK